MAHLNKGCKLGNCCYFFSSLYLECRYILLHIKGGYSHAVCICCPGSCWIFIRLINCFLSATWQSPSLSYLTTDRFSNHETEEVPLPNSQFLPPLPKLLRYKDLMLHLPVRNYAECSTQKLAIKKKNPFTLIIVEELQTNCCQG